MASLRLGGGAAGSVDDLMQDLMRQLGGRSDLSRLLAGAPAGVPRTGGPFMQPPSSLPTAGPPASPPMTNGRDRDPGGSAAPRPSPSPSPSPPGGQGRMPFQQAPAGPDPTKNNSPSQDEEPDQIDPGQDGTPSFSRPPTRQQYGGYSASNLGGGGQQAPSPGSNAAFRNIANNLDQRSQAQGGQKQTGAIGGQLGPAAGRGKSAPAPAPTPSPQPRPMRGAPSAVLPGPTLPPPVDIGALAGFLSGAGNGSRPMRGAVSAPAPTPSPSPQPQPMIPSANLPGPTLPPPVDLSQIAGFLGPQQGKNPFTVVDRHPGFGGGGVGARVPNPWQTPMTFGS